MKRLANKIFLEDCFSFLERLPERSIDLAVIDPPYNLGKGKWDKFDSHGAFVDFTHRWVDAFLPVMKPTGSFYIFNTPYNAAWILQALLAQGVTFRSWITWYKKDGLSTSKKNFVNNQETILFGTMAKEYLFNADEVRVPYLCADRMKHAAKKGIIKNGKRWYPNPRGRLCTDVWEFVSHRHTVKRKGRIVKPDHPTPKPEGMIERMVLASSKPGDMVLDLFSGTGTTALVSRRLKRKFVGCENNRAFHRHLQRRLTHASRKSPQH